MNDFFTVIGGMGTQATESYIHYLNLNTNAKSDQEYLDYILVNHASVPDRTDYILDSTKPNPFLPLKEDIIQQSKLKPKFFTLPCNTAHYFFDDLQSLTSIPILHMPRIAINSIKSNYSNVKRVGLLATDGTLHDGVYDKEIIDAGYELVKPTKKIAEDTMTLIYKYIKEKNEVNEKLFHHMLDEMINQLNCDVVVLGCTELSLAQDRCGNHNYPIIDAQMELVNKTIQKARS
ncbi:amino acid racemase [Lactobacillus sp. S2-2]|uniref:aspartate/glutamate racemase family protein n=1 Tax=Lactobacillus sp. S2-2 TaxID=2692917 RepID=UPI001F01F4BF|nr:amino acid racemase [Lactobacillus sp. S2-2]MCF6515172.1 amino acid racemase [Lactobacillus sp. S2-2]